MNTTTLHSTNRSLLAATALALISAMPAAIAQPVFTTGFEAREGYVADAPLVGQDGWVAPPPLSPNAALVTGDKPRQGKQSV